MGFEPPHLIPDGNIHRFPAPEEKRSRQSAWYWYIGTAGVFGDWRDGVKYYWFEEDRNKTYRESSKEEIATRKRLSIERFVRETKQKEVGQRMAESMWTYAKEGGHPYLVRKGLSQSYGTRVLDPRLLVPLSNNYGAPVNLQRIYPSGAKRFLSGGEAAGVFFIIDRSEERRVGKECR